VLDAGGALIGIPGLTTFTSDNRARPAQIFMTASVSITRNTASRASAIQ